MSLRQTQEVKPLTHGTTGMRLTPTDKLVLLALADYVNDRHGHAWPTIAQLAVVCCIQERSVRRILRRLEHEHKLLEVKLSTGRGRANEYRFSKQGGLFVEKAVEMRKENRTVGPRTLESTDRGVPEKGTSRSSQQEATGKTNPPVVPPRGDKNSPACEKPSYLQIGRHIVEIFMGNRKRLFTDNEWEAMAGSSVMHIVERIRGRGFPARLVPDDELEWEEKTA